MYGQDSSLRTVVGPTRLEWVVIWLGFPVLGAAAGWLLKAAAGWLLSLRWVPFRGPLELIDSIPEPWGVLGAVAVGAVLGLVISLTAVGEQLTVLVGDDDVSLIRDGKSEEIARSSVKAVFVEDKSLILLGPATEELGRDRSDLATGRLRDAFTARGYPWLDSGDPYRTSYRRWVDGAPELSAGVNAVLRARARAIEKGDKDDIAALRDELATLGVVVRDEGKRQHWRLIHRRDQLSGSTE